MQLKYSLKLAILLSIFTVACKNAPQKSIPKAENELFYFKTTECMGTCPVFTFTVLPNGKCTYNGIANVDKMGAYQGNINSDQLAELKNELSNSKFFGIKLKNDSLVKDLPTSYLYYNDGNREKTIAYYHPKNKSVDDLIEFSYELIKKINWSRDN